MIVSICRGEDIARGANHAELSYFVERGEAGLSEAYGDRRRQTDEPNQKLHQKMSTLYSF